MRGQADHRGQNGDRSHDREPAHGVHGERQRRRAGGLRREVHPRIQAPDGHDQTNGGAGHPSGDRPQVAHAQTEPVLRPCREHEGMPLAIATGVPRQVHETGPTKLRAAERDEGEALSRWPMDRSVFTPRAAEQLALGQEWRGAAVHPWTRARIHDWFAQYDHPAARLPIARLSQIRELATHALFAKLAEHGVERDAAVFASDAGRHDGRGAWAFASQASPIAPAPRS